MDNEVWVDVDGTDGVYRVSNHGNVISKVGNRFIRNIKFMKDCEIHSDEKILKPSPNHQGYYHVNLHGFGVKKVHRLVASAFIPNPKNNPEVNHIDGNKSNNHYSNLEWVTHNENMKHAAENGLMPTQLGVLNGNSRMTEQDIYHIKLMLKYKYSYSKISLIFEVSKSLIARISQGKAWNHITLK